MRGDGRTADVKFVDNVYTVSAKPQKSSDEGDDRTTYFCEVISVDEEGEYSVRLYEDKSQSWVGSGKLQLCMCHPLDRLEVGDWVLGTETTITEITISEGI